MAFVWWLEHLCMFSNLRTISIMTSIKENVKQKKLPFANIDFSTLSLQYASALEFILLNLCLVKGAKHESSRKLNCRQSSTLLFYQNQKYNIALHAWPFSKPTLAVKILKRTSKHSKRGGEPKKKKPLSWNYYFNWTIKEETLEHKRRIK